MGTLKTIWNFIKVNLNEQTFISGKGFVHLMIMYGIMYTIMFIALNPHVIASESWLAIPFSSYGAINSGEVSGFIDSIIFAVDLRLWAALIVGFIVLVVVEMAQEDKTNEKGTFSWPDIAWGVIGIVLGYYSHYVFHQSTALFIVSIGFIIYGVVDLYKMFRK